MNTEDLKKNSSENSSDIIPLNDDEFQYEYQRVSTYNRFDPNMCSTAARFSPDYTNHQNTVTPIETEQSPQIEANVNSYKNGMLVHCGRNNKNKNQANHHTQLINQLNNYQAGQTENEVSYISYNSNLIKHIGVPNDDFHQSEQLYCEEIIQNEQNISFIEENVNINETRDEHEIPTPISLQQHSNGHRYEDYYMPSDHNGEIVELVQIAAEEDGNIVYHNLECEEQTDTAVHYNFPNVDEVQLGSANENNYLQSYSNVKRPEIISEKDHQRILLEKTMSPLLAAVNDITQREAELQSYLQPNFDTQKSSSHISYFRKTFISKESSDEDDDYLFITDNPVESRAKASLPTNYLQFHYNNNNFKEPIVIAKKEIYKRSKFGPLEGDIRFLSDVMLDVLKVQTPRFYPLFLIGETRMLELSNENTSNWMRYVRMAQNYNEQNLYVTEEEGKIYFKCCKNIHPTDELKVGYSKSYAEYYGLQFLSINEGKTHKLNEEENPWSCVQCEAQFITSDKLQDHLDTIHNANENLRKSARRKFRKTSKPIKRVIEISEHSKQCFYCLKIFVTSVNLKKHMATHFTEKPLTESCSDVEKPISKPNYKCNYCRRRFHLEAALKSHLMTHSKDEVKPHKCDHCNRHCATPAALAAHIRSHTNRFYTCIYCNEKFKHVVHFRSHFEQHSVDGVYFCHHCQKKYKEYRLVRKHVRMFHRSIEYPCDQCNKKFKHTSFLRRHKETHLSKKEFLCSECGRQFRRKDKLKDHTKKVHSKLEKAKKQKPKKKICSHEYDDSQYLKQKNQKKKRKKYSSHEQNKLKKNMKGTSENYENCVFKCDGCRLGFKRRGMLINHMAKHHPDISIDSIPELNVPILKIHSIFLCNYCPKVYKSNAKRKIHILKNHPGEKVPPTLRGNSAELTNVKTIGSFKAEIQKCNFCYKQYVSRSRLLAHYHKAHNDEEQLCDNAQYTLPSHFNPLTTSFSSNVLSENKLLTLSSVLEDRRFFDFLNEKPENNSSKIVNGENISLSDTQSQLSTFQKVDTNYKILESEFAESSSNTDLNRLFDESVDCI